MLSRRGLNNEEDASGSLFFVFSTGPAATRHLVDIEGFATHRRGTYWCSTHSDRACQPVSLSDGAARGGGASGDARLQMKHDDTAGPVELRGNRDMKLTLHGGGTSFRVGAWLHKADIMCGGIWGRSGVKLLLKARPAGGHVGDSTVRRQTKRQHQRRHVGKTFRVIW